jgi:hypothetical protein
MNDTRIRNWPSLTKPYSENDMAELDRSINNILEDMKKKPLAQDIVVVDTIYPYLNYLRSVNSRNLDDNNKSSSSGTTLIWNVGTMHSSETWWARIHARLNLSLPIEVSNEMTPVVFYELNNTTPISEVRYTWFTGFKGRLPIPEGEIKF